MMCKAISKSTTKQCMKKAYKEGYCSNHFQSYINKIYKEEISNLHLKLKNYEEELNDLKDKFNTIDEAEKLKIGLIDICSSKSYWRVVRDKYYRREIERLFGKPFKECRPYFEKLMYRRNEIVHPFEKFQAKLLNINY